MNEGYRSYSSQILQEIETCIYTLDDTKLERFLEAIQKADKIFCDGKGRSGLQAKAFAMRLAQMGIMAFDTAGVTTPAIGEGDLLIICSGSGETPNLVEHARKAKKLGAVLVLITTSGVSQISQLSDYCFEFRAQSKQESGQNSIQPMGTLFEQSLEIFFDTVVMMLMDKMGITDKDMYGFHNNLE
ncbi:MAG: 6-phospho-3-hexuloisomerase [Bariatricus sp.]